MKLRALEIEQFRKFDRPVRLSGFADGANVLCGPNEFGKSTILAAIRGVLFERHNSKAEPIKRMQSWRGNAAPRLAMEFETAGGLWRIEKRFLHQPMACLIAPDGGRFDGEAAEEELQRLLGFGAPGKQGAKSEHMGVWGALWVTQRESVQQADLSSDLARATITGCLEAEVGVLTGGEKGQALMRTARAQLALLLDGNGKPKGRYRQVLAAVEELDAKLRELRERAARLSEDAAELRRCTGLLERESDPGADERDRAAIEDARRRREAAIVYQGRLEAARSALALAERECADAERETLARGERAAAMRAGEGTLAAAGAAEAEASRAADDAEARLAAARAGLAVAQARADAAGLAARRGRDVVEMLRRVAALAAQERAAAQAEAAQGRINGLLARLEAMRLDGPRIAAIRKTARDRETASSVLSALATQVEFDLSPDALGRVAVRGVPAAPGRGSIAVVEDTEISIAGIGRIRVRPAIRDRDKLLRKLQVAEDALRAALLAGACADPDEAEQRWSEREALERELGEARAELGRLAPGDAASGLAPGARALLEHVDILRRRVREDRTSLGLECLPTHERGRLGRERRGGGGNCCRGSPGDGARGPRRRDGPAWRRARGAGEVGRAGGGRARGAGPTARRSRGRGGTRAGGGFGGPTRGGVGRALALPRRTGGARTRSAAGYSGGDAGPDRSV